MSEGKCDRTVCLWRDLRLADTLEGGEKSDWHMMKKKGGNSTESDREEEVQDRQMKGAEFGK